MKQAVAAGLAVVAGFVDAVAYLALGEVFVAFMSGNSTMLGMGVEGQDLRRTVLAAGLVGCFVAGVMAGHWMGRACGVRKAPGVMMSVAAALAVAAGLFGAGLAEAAGLALALAMGAENTVLAEPGTPSPGLTYMTGTLVRIGERLASGRFRAAGPDAVLWAGMVVGDAAGAVAHGWAGVAALWVAVVVLLGLAVPVRNGVG